MSNLSGADLDWLGSATSPVVASPREQPADGDLLDFLPQQMDPVGTLMALGFDRSACAKALEKAGGDVEAAATLLLDAPTSPPPPVAPPAPAAVWRPSPKAEVVKLGKLSKKGRTHRGVWNTRVFVLTTDALRWYRPDEEVLSNDNARGGVRTQRCVCRLSDGVPSGKQFELAAEDVGNPLVKIKLTLAAASPKEARAWIAALEAHSGGDVSRLARATATLSAPPPLPAAARTPVPAFALAPASAPPAPPAVAARFDSFDAYKPKAAALAAGSTQLALAIASVAKKEGDGAVATGEAKEGASCEVAYEAYKDAMRAYLRAQAALDNTDVDATAEAFEGIRRELRDGVGRASAAADRCFARAQEGRATSPGPSSSEATAMSAFAADLAAANLDSAAPAAAAPTWQPVTDAAGRTYYHNAATGEVTWDTPAELRAEGAAPATATEGAAEGASEGGEWDEVQTAEGKPYYVHRTTRETRWDKPPTAAAAPAAAPAAKRKGRGERVMTMLELITTEAKHVAALRAMVALRESLLAAKPQVASAADLDLIFAGVETIAGVNEALLNKLHERMDSAEAAFHAAPAPLLAAPASAIAATAAHPIIDLLGDGAAAEAASRAASAAAAAAAVPEEAPDPLQAVCVGDVLVKLVPFLRMYTAYSDNFDAAAAAVRRLVGDGETPFSRALAPRMRAANVDGELQVLLIKPVQRVPRYELLIQRLAKATPASHPDADALAEAVVTVKSVAAHIDESIRRKEALARLVTVQARFCPRIDALLENPAREVVREGDLTKVHRGAGVAPGLSAESETYHFVLFTDRCVAYGSKIFSGYYKFHRLIKITGVAATPVPAAADADGGGGGGGFLSMVATRRRSSAAAGMGPAGRDNAFEILGDKNMIVAAASLADKQAWLADLRRVCGEGDFALK